MTDPNVGYITQALGHLSATDLLHGHMPYWNYFEGLGTPLLGEMQAASLFPLTLLFLLPAGLLWFHISLEIIAGLATYFLVRRFSLSPMLATTAAVLFALNGTFAWIGNAVLNPIAFLPLLLLGIEMVLDSAKSSRRAWFLVALALSLSLYSGFPEIAYLDGLFALGWTAVRMFSLERSQRWFATRSLGIGGAIGLLASLPVIVPFYDYMKVAHLGGHSSVDATAHLPLQALPMLFHPYAYGTLFSNLNVANFWGNIGGYFTISVTALALLGLFGSRWRSLRMYLGGWILLGTMAIFDVLHTRSLWNLLPFVKATAFMRYINPSAEIAMIILAVMGISDLLSEPRSVKRFKISSVVAFALLVWCALEARALNQGVVIGHSARLIFILLDVLPFLAVGSLLLLSWFTSKRYATLLICGVLVIESLAMFFVPTAESPTRVDVDMAPIHFLQQHQGEQRFFDMGVLTPNWGSQFGLNQLNQVEMPFPKTFATYILSSLYPGLDPVHHFTIQGGLAAGVPAQEKELVAHFANYQNASVKYLLYRNYVNLPGGKTSPIIISPALVALGVKEVFRDELTTIYELPNPRPFYSTKSSTCQIMSSAPSTATVICPSATTLLRTELSMAGWHAKVNSKEVPITTVNGVYQQISLPAGVSHVEYNFTPPHQRYALLVGLAALLYLAGAWGFEVKRRKDSPVPSTE